MTHTNDTRYVTEWGWEGRGEGNEEEGYIASMNRSTYVVVCVCMNRVECV